LIFNQNYFFLVVLFSLEGPNIVVFDLFARIVKISVVQMSGAFTLVYLQQIVNVLPQIS